jgi:hypothetical protein
MSKNHYFTYFRWLVFVSVLGCTPRKETQGSVHTPPAHGLSYTPFSAVRAYEFFATPALYPTLADTAHPPQNFIHPGGHAYVLGTVGVRWYVVSFDSLKKTPIYYMRQDDLAEVLPYTP